MAKSTTKATFYLDTDLYRLFKVKAALTDKKLSDLMNETLRLQVEEDEADVKALRHRSGGASETFDDFLAGLKSDGLV